LVLGFLYTVAERNERDGKAENGRAENLYDGLWIIATTFEKIGYGHIYPSTHPGRFVATIAALLGPFLVASLVLAVYNQL
jgi:hypothetical protein